MNSDSPKGGIVTPEAPLPDQKVRPADYTSKPAAPYAPTPYPSAQSPYPYPSPQAPRSRERGGSQWVAWVIGGTLGVVIVVSLLVALLAALIGSLVVSTIGQRELSATSTKTFVVSGTPNLVLSDTAGNVTIQPGDGSQVIVHVTKHAWGSSDAVAQGGLDHMLVDMRQSGNTVTVSTQFGASYFDGGPTRRTVDLLVTVPAQANADVHLAAGNLNTSRITGAIRLDASAGNVTADNVTFAGSSRLNTAAGNIQVNGTMARGAALDVHVGAGNATLTLPADTPAHLDASSGVGNLTISGWQIPVTHTGITGYHASGDLGTSPTGTLTVQVGTGNVTLRSR